MLYIYAFYLLPFKEGEAHRAQTQSTIMYSIYGKAGRQNNSRQKIAWAEIRQKSSGNSTSETQRGWKASNEFPIFKR